MWLIYAVGIFLMIEKKDVEKQQGKENKSWFSMPAVQQCLPA